MDINVDVREPGRKIDALVWLVLNDRGPTLAGLRHVDGDWQPHAGYPVGHISPPHYSTDDGDAMEVFNWMSKRGHAVLCNGDGDSFDCDWMPYTTLLRKSKYVRIRAMDGYDCESYAHAICAALLVGVGAVEVNE